MNVLVTGGAGYIGSATAMALMDAGHEVVIFDDFSTGSRDVLSVNTEVIEGSLQKQSQLSRVLKDHSFAAVVYCAGLSALSPSLNEPGPYYHSVLTNGVNLLEAMTDHSCRRLIYISGSAVYGAPQKMPVDERVSPDPITPGGHAILVFEQMLDWYQKINDFHPTVLRVFNAAGAMEGQKSWAVHPDHLFSRILSVLLGIEKSIPVYGDDHPTPDGTCIRDYVHVKDVARAVCCALASEKSGRFNIGSGDGYSINQVIEMARRCSGHDLPVKMMSKRPGEPPQMVAACHRAKMEMEWKPEHSRLQEMVQSTLDWASDHEAMVRKRLSS